MLIYWSVSGYNLNNNLLVILSLWYITAASFIVEQYDCNPASRSLLLLNTPHILEKLPHILWVNHTHSELAKLFWEIPCQIWHLPLREFWTICCYKNLSVINVWCIQKVGLNETVKCKDWWHKVDLVFTLLFREGLQGAKTAKLLLSWPLTTGFGIKWPP